MKNELKQCLFCDNITKYDECAVCNPEAYFEPGTDEHWHFDKSKLLNYHLKGDDMSSEGKKSIVYTLHVLAGDGNNLKKAVSNKIKLLEYLLGNITEEDTRQHERCARYLSYYRGVQIVHLESGKYELEGRD